ncbi:MAG TPA: hypothetical protein VG097_07365 [Gemmata sp.]|jgi:hypothetical protein|nr:hypothetical protein [Gemmata sp.]
MPQDITPNPENGWNVAWNVGELTIEYEPQTREVEKLNLNLVPPSI